MCLVDKLNDLKISTSVEDTSRLIISENKKNKKRSVYNQISNSKSDSSCFRDKKANYKLAFGFLQKNIDCYPSNVPSLFTNIELQGVITSHFDHRETSVNKSSNNAPAYKKCNYECRLTKDNFNGVAHLKDDLTKEYYVRQIDCHINRTLGISVMKKYLGLNLLNGIHSYVPTPPSEFTCLESLVSFIKLWETENKVEICKEETKLTWVCRRHQLAKLALKLITNESFETAIVFYKNKLYLHETDYSLDGIYSKNDSIKRACYTGFELERVLTKSEKDATPDIKDLFFLVSKANLLNGTDVVFQSEIDAMSSTADNNSHKKRNNFIEIKSSVPLKSSSFFHGQKLLKMWVQTGFVDNSDILIGFRTSTNNLSGLRLYSRLEIQRLLKKYYNVSKVLNPKITCDWLEYITEHINNSILDFIKEKNLNTDYLISLKLNLTTKRDFTGTLSLDLLDSVPSWVDMIL